TETSTELSFISTQAIVFNHVEIDVSSCNTIRQLERLLTTALTSEMNKDMPQLIHLTFKVNHEEVRAWKEHDYFDELVDVINYSFLYQIDYIYIYVYAIYTLFTSDAYHKFEEGDHLYQDLEHIFRSISIQPYLQDLSQHRKARKY